MLDNLNACFYFNPLSTTKPALLVWHNSDNL